MQTYKKIYNWQLAFLKKATCCFIAINLFFLSSGCLLASQEEISSVWQDFKKVFVSDSGRVIDVGNAGISHSEGQGIGMFLSVFFDDKDTFELIWHWTKNNLSIRKDGLFAWKWVPDGNTGKVADMNNATDGDIFIAWALIRASEKWNNESYLKEAIPILAAIRSKLVIKNKELTLLLPGESGFLREKGIIINLSYWIFPAFHKFYSLFPDQKEWKALEDSGLIILKTVGFGRWKLPPNWLFVSDHLDIPSDFKPHFGFDAIRIPLYLTWSGIHDDNLLKPYRDFWSYFDGAKFLPSWTNLIDDSVDSYDAPCGIYGIRDLILKGVVNTCVINSKNYYSSALTLLTHIASLEKKDKEK
jgi:endoglucanase